MVGTVKITVEGRWHSGVKRGMFEVWQHYFFVYNAEPHESRSAWMATKSLQWYHCGRAMFATTGKFVQMNAKANLFALCWVPPNLDKISFSSPKECASAPQPTEWCRLRLANLLCKSTIPSAISRALCRRSLHRTGCEKAVLSISKGCYD